MAAELACFAPDDRQVQQAVAYVRQAWVNHTGLKETEERAQLKLRADKATFEDQQHKDCGWGSRSGRDRKQPVREQLFAAATRAVICHVVGGDDALGYWLDRRAAADSEIVHTQFVTTCFTAPMGSAEWPDPKLPAVVAAFALCGPDARRLDRARLDRELADARFSDFARLQAVVGFSRAQALYGHLDEAYRAMAKADPALQTLLYDAPEAGWARWEKAYADHQADFEAALAYEDQALAAKSGAPPACDGSLRKAFDALVRAAQPKDVAQADAVGLGLVGGVLLEELVLCDEAAPLDPASMAELTHLREVRAGRQRRGPRVEAYAAVMAALPAVAKDHAGLVAVEQFWPRVPFEVSNGLAPLVRESGTIVTVKAEGDRVRVTLKEPFEAYSGPLKCTDTDRIRSVDHDGEVHYEQACQEDPNNERRQAAAEILVPAAFAGTLKPGRTVILAVDTKAEGMPLAVFADAKQTKLVGWLGVSLE